jgi:hypothetical protein
MYFASFAFLPEKPCQTGTLVKRLLLMLINVGVSPNGLHHPTSGTIRSSRRQFRRQCLSCARWSPHSVGLWSDFTSYGNHRAFRGSDNERPISFLEGPTPYLLAGKSTVKLLTRTAPVGSVRQQLHQVKSPFAASSVCDRIAFAWCPP